MPTSETRRRETRQTVETVATLLEEMGIVVTTAGITTKAETATTGISATMAITPGTTITATMGEDTTVTTVEATTTTMVVTTMEAVIATITTTEEVIRTATREWQQEQMRCLCRLKPHPQQSLMGIKGRQGQSGS